MSFSSLCAAALALGLGAGTRPQASLPSFEGSSILESTPFSFVYDGRQSTQLLPRWKLRTQRKRLDRDRTQRTITYVDSDTGLVVRLLGVEYRDFPAVEWTLWLKNAGKQDTPIIENLQALDTRFLSGTAARYLLHHNVGSPANGEDYRPLETPLPPNSSKRIGGAGGRPTNSDLSYFNVSSGDRGTIVAVGWPGQWAADFECDYQNTLRLRAGQERTHFKLHPGEEVRTPLIALLNWKGDWIDGQNQWRRWMLAHNVPRPGGKLPSPMMEGYSGRVYGEMIGANEVNQKMFIDRYLEEGLKLDYWWMDAGWYVQTEGWPQVGTWEVDRKRFPNGLKPISEYAHARGMKTLVWFEPERVAPHTWLADNHPEWLLKPPAGISAGGDQLLDLGNPNAWHWLVEHIDKLLVDNKIDLYRQDFNMDPLGYWRSNDAPDRQGITEIKHVMGYLAYWDELRRRHPNMLIDSCASGGRRNDLETMRRAVPLWRSDYAYKPLAHQSMTFGISMWLPYDGTGTVANEDAPYYGTGALPVHPYAFWSNAAPSIMFSLDIREKSADYATLRRLVAAWKSIWPYYYGDFYPLTPDSIQDDNWIAWQYNRPEKGDGIIQAFRRPLAVEQAVRLKLRGLNPLASYRTKVVDGESNVSQQQSGKDLMETGIKITLENRPSAVVIKYSRL